MKSTRAEEYINRDIQSGPYGDGNFSDLDAERAVEIAEEDMELSRDNLSVWAFCEICATRRHCNGYVKEREYGMAWKFRHDACARKAAFVRLLENN